MKIIDEKIRINLFSYIFQCMLATITLVILLFFLNVFTETVLIASVGSTAFIVFAMPKTYASAPRRLIGGYGIGIIIGIICFYLGDWMHSSFAITSFFTYDSPVFFAALAVGLSIFIMTITNTEHAPAAGIALGLVLNQWTIQSVIFIIIVMIAMIVVKHVLQSLLINLSSHGI